MIAPDTVNMVANSQRINQEGIVCPITVYSAIGRDCSSVQLEWMMNS